MVTGCENVQVRRLQKGVARVQWFYRYYAEHHRYCSTLPRCAAPWSLRAAPDVRPNCLRSDGSGDAMGGGGKPVDPLVAGRLPDGGATEMLLRELERRADGSRAAACAKEMKEPHHYHRWPRLSSFFIFASGRCLTIPISAADFNIAARPSLQRRSRVWRGRSNRKKLGRARRLPCKGGSPFSKRATSVAAAAAFQFNLAT